MWSVLSTEGRLLSMVVGFWLPCTTFLIWATTGLSPHEVALQSPNRFVELRFGVSFIGRDWLGRPQVPIVRPPPPTPAPGALFKVAHYPHLDYYREDRKCRGQM
jgi:hypothetical protein